MEELYIDDADFNTYYIKIMEVHNVLETRLSNIIAELQKACAAVSEGDFHTNLEAFCETLLQTQGDLMEMTGYMIEKASEFVLGIQEIDKENIGG